MLDEIKVIDYLVIHCWRNHSSVEQWVHSSVEQWVYSIQLASGETISESIQGFSAFDDHYQ